MLVCRDVKEEAAGEMAWLIRATLIRLVLSTDFCKRVTATCKVQHKENSQGSCPRVAGRMTFTQIRGVSSRRALESWSGPGLLPGSS